jgi:hypothetical protein
MSSNNVRPRRSIGKGTIAAVLILVMLIGYAIYMALSGGGGGGRSTTNTTVTGTPSTSTTVTGTPSTSNVLYPNGDIVNGYDLILVEDHVSVANGQYHIVASAIGAFKSLVAYGGSTVSGNITNGVGIIKYGGYIIPVIGFASTNSNITQDFPGIKVRLDTNGGYVLYTPISMAVYYRHYQYNVSSTVVHVWVPAKTQPTTLASASLHVVVDPQYGTYYINGVAYGLDVGTPPRQYRGILRSWLVYTTAGGKYVFTINP